MSVNCYDVFLERYPKLASKIGLSVSSGLDDHGQYMPLNMLKGEMTRLSRCTHSLKLLAERDKVTLCDMAKQKLFAHWVNPVFDQPWSKNHFVHKDVRKLTLRNLQEMSGSVHHQRAEDCIRIVRDVFIATNGFKSVPGPRPFERLQAHLDRLGHRPRDIFLSRCVQKPPTPCQKLAERHATTRPKIREIETQVKRKLQVKLGGDGYMSEAVHGLRQAARSKLQP